jgi:hypothetical protein
MLPNEATTVPHLPPLALLLQPKRRKTESQKQRLLLHVPPHNPSKTRPVRRFGTQNDATSSSSERRGRCEISEHRSRIGAQLAAWTGRRIADQSSGATNGGAGRAPPVKRPREPRRPSADSRIRSAGGCVQNIDTNQGPSAVERDRAGEQSTEQDPRPRRRARAAAATGRDGTGRGACTWRR